MAEHKILIEKIKKLKKQKNAVILAHNYQRPEIYDVADFIGDSLKLCLEARETDADIILFCGVSFMAETACILNPDKKVIVPFIDAGCAMADMLSIEALRKMKKAHPGVPVVTYVNSSAEVKAESDYCCTSANAVEVVRRIEGDKVLFVPDRNLAGYVGRQVPEKKVIAFDGYCPVHDMINAEYLDDAIKTYPSAKLIAHPECRQEVLERADAVRSTSGMIKAVQEMDAEEFFVLTECGMIERLKREVPGKKFYGLCNMCFDMKKNNLESVFRCLEDEGPKVKVDKNVASKALLSLENMFDIMEDHG
ncbi:quinolinate synthase NadA [Patescibacteria group bacterium]|nr:quinolinate synthase NadA [Patescibacteria group bacterium]